MAPQVTVLQTQSTLSYPGRWTFPTQGTRHLLLDSRSHASQKYGHAPSSDCLLQSPMGENNILASNKALLSCDEEPRGAGKRPTRCLRCFPVALPLPVRMSNSRGRSQICKRNGKDGEQGNHTDGIFPVSSGNTEYIHKSLTWIKGNGYHLELARVVKSS